MLKCMNENIIVIEDLSIVTKPVLKFVSQLKR